MTKTKTYRNCQTRHTGQKTEERDLTFKLKLICNIYDLGLDISPLSALPL